MSTKTEPKRIGDLVLAEWDQRSSRKSGTFQQSSGSTADYVIGQVCVVSSSKYVPATGSTFGGVLLKNLSSVATATDVTKVPFLTKGPAVISKSQLVFDAGCDASEQAAIITAMEALLITVVDEPTQQTTA